MDNFFKSPVARRTRSQWQRFEYQRFCASSSTTSTDQPRKRNREQVFSDCGSINADRNDPSSVHKTDSKKTTNQNGFGEPSRFHIESSLDEPEEKEDDEEESDGVKVIENSESIKMENKYKYCGSADPPKSGTHTYFLYSSDDSDSDDTVVSIKDEEEVDEDLQIFLEDNYESQNDVKASSDQFLEDDESDSDEPYSESDSKIKIESESESENESESESESESDSSDDSDFDLLNKRSNHFRDRKMRNPLLQKTNIKKLDQKVTKGSSGIYSHKKMNTKDKVSNPAMTSDIANGIKGRQVSHKDDDGSVDTTPNAVKGRRNQQKDDGISVEADPITVKDRQVPKKDDGVSLGANPNEVKGRRVAQKEKVGSVDDILDSIIRNVSGLRDDVDGCLPLRFRFDDSEDESSSKETGESDAEILLKEMDFELNCEEIGSYRVGNREKDDMEITDVERCERGEHVDVYLEEETGLRCRLCGAVLLESRYVIPTLANFAPNRSRRSYFNDEEQRFFSFENMYLERSEFDRFDICNQKKGTVWELIPINIRVNLYPHQQEGFEFIWKNLAGTIELSRLHEIGSVGHGGCIISHAPGTGKTLLTIVFIESFLKRFPKCCPVIIAPANMLLTWEAEFKKWQMGFSFINLNDYGFSRKNMVHKNLIRAMKIRSWADGGSVLGVSYNLYEKLAGGLEKMGSLLLDMPGLVVLDEGHTPRNQGSNIWNVLLKLKTKNRVILSGTPFQNNFVELFNTLRIVRPSIATDIMKDFADLIHQNRRKHRGSEASASKGIEKLKAIISPFVHVHKGNILESKLYGLKKSIVILNPPPFQKRLLENLGNLAKTFEYEHKLALVSVHPALILHCSLSEEEENTVNKQELEKARLEPDLGVKARFVMELIRLSMLLDEKVLIFSQYIQPLKLLKDQISSIFSWEFGRELMLIRGKVHQNARQTIINKFNDPKSEMKVLLASTKCCSEGIHLIGASRVVLLDVVWNPSVERQAISRAYRIGQKKAVYTYHLLSSGTTEDVKYNRQVEKGRLGELVIFSAMNGKETESKSKAETDRIQLNDKILQQMMDHKELEGMIKEIRYAA